MDYDPSFYDNRAASRIPAARRVMRDLAPLIQPRSMIDIGCGDGSFLAVAAEFGVVERQGVEGVWIDDAQLVVAPALVCRHDLSQSLRCERRYDLAVSIEVAEHLPPRRAHSFVDDLTWLADVLLFSAAIPGQGGTHHVNERWQSYWAEIFARRDYYCIDGLRRALWTAPEVPHSWRQNLLLYASEQGLRAWPALAAARERHASAILDIVHPRYFWRASKPRSSRSSDQAATAAHATLQLAAPERARRCQRAALSPGRSTASGSSSWR